MIPRKEHLKQVNRFHDLVEDLGKRIDKSTGDEKSRLCLQYFELTSNIWPLVDNSIEKVKDALDNFEFGEK